MAKNIATVTLKLREDASLLNISPDMEPGRYIEIRRKAPLQAKGFEIITAVLGKVEGDSVSFYRHVAYKGLQEEAETAELGHVFYAQQRCTHCQDILAMEEFPKNKNIKDGHHAICKLCDKGKVEAAARGEEFIPESRYHVEDGTNKQCTKCKQWKWEADFNVDRSRPDGLTSQCKECRRAARRAR